MRGTHGGNYLFKQHASGSAYLYSSSRSGKGVYHDVHWEVWADLFAPSPPGVWWGGGAGGGGGVRTRAVVDHVAPSPVPNGPG